MRAAGLRGQAKALVFRALLAGTDLGSCLTTDEMGTPSTGTEMGQSQKSVRQGARGTTGGGDGEGSFPLRLSVEPTGKTNS